MNDLSIVLSGEAGQGINSVEKVLLALLKKTGYRVYATKEYMSRVRGGVNSISIRVSCDEVKAFVKHIDILIPFEKAAFSHLKDRISDETIIIGDKKKLENERVIDVSFQQIATEFGNALYVNSVAVGLVSGLMNLNRNEVLNFIKDIFAKKGDEIADKNAQAAESGYEIGTNLVSKKIITLDVCKPETKLDNFMISGTDAIALGAIAGGCDCAFAYPMSPGTSVFTALATYSHKAGILIEQTEDEIAAVNMAVAGWYAGARPIVSTSGGGFALMTEGMSLAGMTESPLVIHIAQRPGPATGLPTRTEQGDLNLALYTGHGVFPRAIYAPGTTQQAFELACRAFNHADQYQIPVIILTDQYFVDTFYDTPAFDLDKIKIDRHIVKTNDNYQRYIITDSGVSPRGIPGFGSGFVCSDSDEHDENGRITEDLDGICIAMKNKRFKKIELIKENSCRPELYGPENYENLIVAWGSTYHMIAEAIDKINNSKTAMLHFSQVYPLHKDTESLLKKSKKLILVENNQTGQFGDLIKLETGINFDHKILKYNGMMFTVEELMDSIKEVL
ncbi:MAG: 2-oxoacid:ferredoxin oxidoreductase subunit alpha [Spirochaetes bacterium GWF1_31_7]|nr:MAG: 2-oxoacid:ferredoxin oxidoreductase subunit alpha [Spirochaetes bacterium GWE1_32_154]OHD47564.1 MAG: 2-oxoacid:ferredoxin oxidoreductase subunit alpha [Spirochaetes bacterium GWF1_31_7]OHD73822.1 MAG: 2-oxoacid:ferredoxin oxidoreductase subunit alpha [Spirochaetes bacterium RIFOXYB1_FULL_32_8]HBD93474.1 2-oxoacid:acceptor oxidoreductase subunit alpha [Spirochaetia bacterium]HBI36219.1 2-oxoacid:acceptor oxidoreductase subunit alpha [Spirochaetia bacterium]